MRISSLQSRVEISGEREWRPPLYLASEPVRSRDVRPLWMPNVRDAHVLARRRISRCMPSADEGIAPVGYRLPVGREEARPLPVRWENG